MTNPNPELEPLRFPDRPAAQSWLDTNNQTGWPHADTHGTYIVVRCYGGNMVAYTGPLTAVVLHDW